jgi:hypothetical protein
MSTNTLEERRYLVNWLHALRQVGGTTWLRAAGFGLAAGVVIAIPTRLVPNGFFSRMTPTRPQDYVLLVVSSALLGLTMALQSSGNAASSFRLARPGVGGGAMEARAVVAGVGTFLAVGCPVCNKVVVALIGTGGALSFFAPLQPVIGLAAVALLVVGLRRQLRGLDATACPRPLEA